MNQVIQDLKQQILADSAHGTDSILDALYDGYANTDPKDQARIEEAFRALEAYVLPLPFSARDRICCIVTELCAEHDRIAYLDGIRTGARLILELLET